MEIRHGDLRRGLDPVGMRTRERRTGGIEEKSGVLCEVLPLARVRNKEEAARLPRGGFDALLLFAAS